MPYRARAVVRTCAVSLVAVIAIGVASGFQTAPPPAKASVPAPAPAPAPTSPATPSFIQGDVRTEVFQIASGERVMVVSDVRIHATNEVVIDGLLLAKPGVTIEIIAPKLTVRGTVCAGSGVNGVDVLEPGGNGGNVILRVADIRVEEGAVIRSGAGGNGSFGASGGDGGDILLLPSSLVSGGGEGTMEAGAGGTGGEGVTGYSDAARNGGNGGSGGAVGVITTSTV